MRGQNAPLAGGRLRLATDAPPGEEMRFGIAPYLLDSGDPDAIAVIENGEAHRYASLRDAVRRVEALLTRLELAPGARVGILAPNSMFWIAAYLGIMTRYVAVPFSDRLTPANAKRQAEFADCRAMVIDRRYGRSHAVAFDGIPMITDADLAQADPDLAPAPMPLDPETDAALMFTSGTTARPKAVRLTHRNLQANTASIISYLTLDRDDRMLVVLPFYYCYGASLLHTHLRAGGSLTLCNTFAFPETAIEMLDRESCTGFAGVPSTYQLLLRASTFATRELPSLRKLQQAGGKLPPALIDELRRAQGQAQLFVMYGQTEATARLSYLPPNLLDSKPGSVGRGIPGVRLEVVDEAGAPVAPGQVGEIVASGANISPGYLADPEATAAKFPGGRLRTGDLATVDDDGYISIVDRRDDFIKSWGHRVSSQEIEAAASQLPDLVAAAVVGVSDPQAGEAIELFAQLRPGTAVSEAEVLRYLRGQLAKHMVPRHVHIVTELPLNAAGKILKGRLKELAQELHNLEPLQGKVGD